MRKEKTTKTQEMPKVTKGLYANTKMHRVGLPSIFSVPQTAVGSAFIMYVMKLRAQSHGPKKKDQSNQLRAPRLDQNR